MKYTCYCGKECKSKSGFKLHLYWHSSKSKIIWKSISLVALILGLIASILAILLLPMPWFDNHCIWNDWFEGKVDITHLRSDNESISFQVVNNRPYMIDDVKIISYLDCGRTTESYSILLKSELEMIPSGQGDIFYVTDKELLHLLNVSTNNILEYQINVSDYPVAFMTKNKNLYAINQRGEITKHNFTNNFSYYDKVCEIETILNYNYSRFGKNIKKSQIISELGATLMSRTRSYGSNQIGSGGFGESFIELCKLQCIECTKYPDWNVARSPISNSAFCRLWFCNETTKKYPNDLISCMVELQGICIWPDGRNLPICEDFGSRLKTECMWYENDECHMSGMLWEYN